MLRPPSIGAFAVAQALPKTIAPESSRKNLIQVNHGNGDRNELEKLCSGNL
jgi:hypothetical protein